MSFLSFLQRSVCFGLWLPMASAQITAPSPTISSVSPLGGRPGSTVELTFKGVELDGAKSILLTSLRDGRAHNYPVEQVPAKKGVLAVKLPADAPADLYDIRLMARYGISNPRVFQISAAGVIESPGTNSKSDTSIKVTTETAIQGTFKASVPHWFSFEGKKDQRVLGSFTGSEFNVRTSLVGSVYDKSGRELARLRDGILDVKLPADGEYKLKINDLMFGVGDDYGYRLSLTTGAVVWAAGKGVAYGWSLPGGEVVPGLRVNRSQPLEYLKADATTITRLIASSPAKVLPLPDESEPPNVVADKPSPLTVGQTFSGWFPANGDARQFDLSFKSGDRFNIELASQQLGYATDPSMLVEMVKGEAVSTQADLGDPATSVPAPNTRITMLDPVYGYEAKADGVFRISVSDPSSAANGRRQPYQLRIRKASEASDEGSIVIYAKLPPAAAVGPHEIPSANLWRNGVAALEVFIPNRTALSEGVELKVENLPSGVTSLGGFIGKGQSLGYIGLRAGPDAPPGASALSGITRTNHLGWPIKDSGREVMITRIAGAPVIAVVPDTAPALIEPAAPGIPEVAADAKLDVPLKVTRHAACTEALKLKVLGFTDPTKAPEVTIAAKALEGKVTLDIKTLKLAPGDYGFILQGTAKMPFQRNADDIAAAQSTAKKAAEAQAAAKKAVDEANAEFKALKPEDKAGQTTQQAKIKDLVDALAKADKAKTDADKAAKDIATKNPAKDTTFLVHSTPIRFRVKETSKK
jgi:hypothetical protein